MIIALLFAAGLLTLLVAPRFHRRSTQKSLAAARNHKQQRIAEMRRSPEIAELKMASEAEAVKARDALLLRGVRSEVASTVGQHVLVTQLADHRVVDEVLAHLRD